MRYLLAASLFIASVGHADPVDDAVKAEMAKRHIHGLSLAIVDKGKLVRASAYGVIDVGGGPVTPDTLFQAGSISKSVSALAALRLVEAGKLGLDDDIDAKLVGWHLPKSILTDIRKITLRQILSHTAGITVHGFPGYELGAPMPTIEQVLDGAKPANTEPIRVDVMPGMMWRYSGGGYTIMQKWMVDATGKTFPSLMTLSVLVPAAMLHSTFEQPPPADKAKLTATGYTDPETKVPGRWHVYPEMAAAGLWTTPSDLMQFGIQLGKAWQGKSPVITQAMAKKMMSVERDGDGLGVFVAGDGLKRNVSHNGRDEGFDAQFIYYPETGQGVAIMINANDNSAAMHRLLQAVQRTYDFPDRPPPPPAGVKVDRAALDAIAGSYEFTNNDVLRLAVVDGALTRMADGLPDGALVPVTADRFVGDGLDVQVQRADGRVTGLRWKRGTNEHESPRIAPPLHTVTARPDPDVAFSGKVLAALRAFADGANDSPALAVCTPGLRRDLHRPYRPLASTKSLTYMDAWPVAIERHGGKVARVIAYRRTPAPGFVMIYVTADGTITDFDLFDD